MLLQFSDATYTYTLKGEFVLTLNRHSFNEGKIQFIGNIQAAYVFNAQHHLSAFI